MVQTKKHKNARSGQTAVEYILIIAVVVGIIFAFGNQFKSKIGEITGQLFGDMSGQMKKLTNPQ